MTRGEDVTRSLGEKYYIYIERERERGGEINGNLDMFRVCN